MGEVLTVWGIIIAVIGAAFLGISLAEESFSSVVLSLIITVIGGSLLICGLSISEDSWECCNETIRSEYCSECGKARPAECKNWTCCDHEYDNDIKFCPDCGAARPTDDDTTNNIVVKDNENVEVNVNSGGVVIVEDNIENAEAENDISTTVPDENT